MEVDYIMQKEITLKIKDAFKLHLLKSKEMYESSAEKNHNFNAEQEAVMTFQKFMGEIGLDNYREASKIAHLVWLNSQELTDMQNAGEEMITFSYNI